MDELHEFCARMLGDREAATRVAQDARRAGGSERLRRLDYAVRACRIAGENRPAPEAAAETGRELAAAVSAELARAAASLPQREQEALALRELLRLSHGEVAVVTGIAPAAVAPLLARSRLGLHSKLRAQPVDTDDCPERERTVRTVTLRQDGEEVGLADDDWLIEHLGHCAGCGRAHAAMLEGSVRYRGWRVPDGFGPADAAGEAQPASGRPAT
jgi:hypothetical protein